MNEHEFAIYIQNFLKESYETSLEYNQTFSCVEIPLKRKPEYSHLDLDKVIEECENLGFHLRRGIDMPKSSNFKRQYGQLWRYHESIFAYYTEDNL